MQYLDVDVDCLRSFVTLAERLVFHEAAASLRISAPALTRRIQRLESALDTALLERSTRQAVLTAEGRFFLPLARDAVAAVDHAVESVRKMSRLRSGHLTLACLPTMAHHLLPGIIRDFHARLPKTHVRVTECGAASVPQAVRDGLADFGFGFPIVARTEADLAFEPILIDPYCLIMPQDHPLAAQQRVNWRELKPHKVITTGRQSGNMKILNKALRGLDWRPEAVYEIDHLTTSLGLVEAGLGIAVVPRSALPLLPPPAMTVRPLTGPEVTRTLGVFRRRNWALPATAQKFLTTVRRTAGLLRAEGQPIADCPS
jgi:DNA-binding transcriptional LysR family regulator